MTEICPTCGKSVELYGDPRPGTNYSHEIYKGLYAFADVRCNLPPTGPGTVVGCATVGEALADW